MHHDDETSGCSINNIFSFDIDSYTESIVPNSKHKEKYALQDMKQLELKSQYWNHVRSRKESHFRFIYQ